LPLPRLPHLGRRSGHCREQADVPALIKKLKDKDAAVRLAAARSLAKIGPAAKAAIPALTQALKDEDPDVRAAVKKALTTIRAGGLDLTEIIEGLKSKRPADRRKAREALAELGMAGMGATTALLESMIEWYPANKDTCLTILAKINPRLHKPIACLMVDEDVQKRCDALASIELLGEEGKPTLVVLAWVYKRDMSDFKNSWRLAERSLQTMSKLEPESRTTVDTIIAAIGAPASGNDEKSEIRATAVKLAVAVKVEPKVMVPALLKALKHDRRHLLTTIEALGNLGADA
jgi:hypothetical protein